ncbi:putative branched-subunit amino acid permease [Neorhizobium galegae]|uniref:AzlC family ABC transporter permease n=1 Tax=Neorhizobium galegae TaxID=399 RepID=UPI001AEABC7C|nr:AzlC family ABC transporter permease [Neorhizobium galegae]MBP2549056.1 putative branched-subunit amino acid permease [Neorhizobium galegae]
MSSSFFRQGARAGMVVGFSTLPFGLLFGAVAVDGGMTPLEATMMSGVIFGGASQLVGVQMFGTHVPAWLIVLSVFAVNFRHILYSAALSPHLRAYSPLARFSALFFLTDPQFAEASKQVDRNGKVEPSWYFGMAFVVYGLWVASSAIGALFGRLVGDPAALGFDVLLPVYFLGLVLGFRRRPLFSIVVPISATASILAMHTVGSPWHVSIGALAGVIAALVLHKPAKTADAGETS